MRNNNRNNNDFMDPAHEEIENRIRPHFERVNCMATAHNFRKLSSNQIASYNSFHFPDTIVPPDGKRYGKFNVMHENAIDPKLISKLLIQGWEPVPASRHPELTHRILRDIYSNTNAKDYIVIGDTMLMERDIQDYYAALDHFNEVNRSRKSFVNMASLNNSRHNTILEPAGYTQPSYPNNRQYSNSFGG